MDKNSEVPSAGAPWRQASPPPVPLILLLLPLLSGCVMRVGNNAPPIAGQSVPASVHGISASPMSLSTGSSLRCRLLATMGLGIVGFTAATCATAGAAAEAHPTGGDSATVWAEKAHPPPTSPLLVVPKLGAWVVGQAVVRPLITRARAVARVLALGVSPPLGSPPEREENEDDADEGEEAGTGRRPLPRGGGGAAEGVEFAGMVATLGLAVDSCVLPSSTTPQPAAADAAAATLLLVLRGRAPVGPASGPAKPRISCGRPASGGAFTATALSPSDWVTVVVLALPSEAVSRAQAGDEETPASLLMGLVLIGDLPRGAAGPSPLGGANTLLVGRACKNVTAERWDSYTYTHDKRGRGGCL